MSDHRRPARVRPAVLGSPGQVPYQWVPITLKLAYTVKEPLTRTGVWSSR
ncbi:hypothetical protein HD593_005280 [Nonomuraea rubra]|uniref:Uncharacterized protein n=1 Tax=Nonomuraea rubra TaxID=46180 RepID=A0A7X0U0M4_9ACTN|nr:hypothetical protein [Nonomuraea rubra]